MFERAAGLVADERGPFLDRACGDDAELRVEVESLLSYDGESAEAVENPRARADSPSLAAPAIDGFQLVRELHRGGQGVVYEAVQKSTKRKVAVKVLLEGAYASRAVRKRFEREIEVAAQLKHPGIIAIFDAAQTEEGRQYCVMDYVRGLPITEYVKTKRLALAEALTLFAKTCDAVQYAHQKGVIHRDLKPSNILVPADGEPKVLDFGLAKLLVGPVETVVSFTGQVVGTLPYMSPEQARGNPDEIDTRTDIYALGIVLYEILTGRFPYPVTGQLADVLRHIAETPPAPPSQKWSPGTGIAGPVAGPRWRALAAARSRTARCPIDHELETIVLRAIAKERDRRYQSAGELAQDIRSYLSGEAIVARRDSRLYVLRKTLVRYRAAVAVVGLLILTLAGALVVSAAARGRADRERDRAQAAEWRKQQVIAILNDILRSANPLATQHSAGDETPERARVLYAGRVGEPATVVDVLRAAGRRLDGLALDPQVEAEVRHALGSTLADNGQFQEAVVQLRKAVDLRGISTGRESTETLASLERLVYATFLEGDMNAVLALAQPAYESLHHARDPLDESVRAFAVHVARGLEALKRPDEAVQVIHDLSAEAAARAGLTDDRVIGLRLELARLLSNRDQPLEALRINRDIMGVLADRPDARHLYARAAEGVADALYDAGRYQEAVEAARTAVEAYEALYGPDHPLTAYQNVYLSWALGQTGQLEEARRVAEAALECHKRFSGDEHEWTYRAERWLARVLALLGDDLVRAETMARHALAGYQRIGGADYVQTLYARDVLGVVLQHAGHLDEAEQVLRENVTLGAAALPGWEYARHLCSLAACLTARGKLDEAEQLLLAAWERTCNAIGAESDAAVQVAGDLARLYETRHAADPGRGYDAKALQWRGRMEPNEIDSKPHVASDGSIP